MEIVDVETMTTYNSKVVEYNGSPAIELIDANIIPTSRDAYEAVNTHQFGKWRIFTGPASRGVAHIPNTGEVSVKVCADRNHFPCMLVRTNASILSE